MKTKTADLTGPALDWAVAKCNGVTTDYINDGITRCLLRTPPFAGRYSPSTDWSQGGPIIEREGIELRSIPAMRIPANWANCAATDAWLAQRFVPEMDAVQVAGPTPLTAAMRCYVASKLGDEIEVPDELV